MISELTRVRFFDLNFFYLLIKSSKAAFKFGYLKVNPVDFIFSFDALLPSKIIEDISPIISFIMNSGKGMGKKNLFDF